MAWVYARVLIGLTLVLVVALALLFAVLPPV